MKKIGIRRTSKKKESDNRKYKIAYEKWKPSHTNCENCGRYVEYGVPPHHKKSRIGEYLYDVKYWMCACLACHALIHKNPKWARENRYLL